MILQRALTTELRLTMRSWSTTAALTFIVILGSAFALAAYSVVGVQMRGGPPPGSGFGAGSGAAAQPPTLSMVIAAERGVALTFAILLFLMMTACLAAGVRASTVVVGEKERQTYDLLWTTKLTSTSFLWAKYLGVLIYSLLVVVTVAPIFGIIAVYGGAPPLSILEAFVLIATTVTASAAAGLVYSSLASSTLSASLLTTLTILVAMISGIALYLVAASYGMGSGWQIVLFASPPAALLSTLVGDFHTPLTLLLPAIVRASPEHPVHVAGRIQNPFALWAVTSVLLIVVTVLLLSSARALVDVSSADGALGRGLRRPWQVLTRLTGKAH